MVNEDYEPDAVEETVLAVLRDAERANPYLIRERAGDLSKQQINNALRNLTAAGWVRKVTRGLYDYVEDPRRDELDVTPDPDATQDGPEGAAGTARLLLQEWEPQDVDTATARDATVLTVEWLAAQDSPQRKAAIEQWYADAELPLAFSTAWQKAIRPGLGALREQGLVAHRTNVGWRVLDGDERE